MQLHDEPAVGDAFGASLLAELHGSPAGDVHFVERSDGLLTHHPTSQYFLTEDRWPAVDRACLAHLGERMLDIGAGAGRVSLAAQQRGLDVTALDVSRGAIEVCQARGVEKVFAGRLEELVDRGCAEPFDTFVMMGNNVGLLGGPAAAKHYLGLLERVGTVDARIVGTVGHVYKTENPDHLRYHERNRALGRMAGELRLRVRYRSLTTPWFDYLFASPEELDEVLRAAGWALTNVVEGSSFIYFAEIRRR